MPWEESLLVGGIYGGARNGLRGARYLVSLGQWAFPVKGWRDLVSAAIVFIGASLLGLSITSLALLSVAIILIWIGVALVVVRRHRELIQNLAAAA